MPSWLYNINTKGLIQHNVVSALSGYQLYTLVKRSNYGKEKQLSALLKNTSVMTRIQTHTLMIQHQSSSQSYSFSLDKSIVADFLAMAAPMIC